MSDSVYSVIVHRSLRPFVGAVLAVGLLAGCGETQPIDSPTVDAQQLGAGEPSPAGTGGAAATPFPQGGEPVRLNPADFTTTIDNPYFPLKPGSRWRYRETEGGGPAQDSEITVTSATKKIQGVETVVVHDVLKDNGVLVEDTYDWYAQDRSGTVWYLGEDVKNYEDGKLANTEGSWEAGVDGAYAGVMMPAHPEVGMAYRQEYYRGHAEDSAKILAVGRQVTVPSGRYTAAVQTQDSTPLKPEVEQKYYAPQVGLVQLVTVAGGSDRSELVEYTQG